MHKRYDNGHCVCGMTEHDRAGALRIARSTRLLVDLLREVKEDQLAYELENSFCSNLMIVGTRSRLATTIERFDENEIAIWLFATEQGILDYRTGKRWLVADTCHPDYRSVDTGRRVREKVA